MDKKSPNTFFQPDFETPEKGMPSNSRVPSNSYQTLGKTWTEKEDKLHPRMKLAVCEQDAKNSLFKDTEATT